MLSKVAVGASLLGAVLAQNYSSPDGLPIVDVGHSYHQATLVNSSYAYYNFSNIRYGQAPVGNLRFAAPVAPVVSNSTNKTINYGQQGNICPQASADWNLVQAQFLPQLLLGQNITLNSSLLTYTNVNNIPTPDPRSTEDCLFLDVLVPQSIWNTTQKAAVWVDIFAGGFISGSKSTRTLNPVGLLQQSANGTETPIIYVSMNYRLGMYGWLGGPTFQENGTANAGLYDQRLAIEWVKNNIANFGGDPNKITLNGGSAGGSSIMHQITAYGGLGGPVPFQRAIMESPAFLPVASNFAEDSTYNMALVVASMLNGTNVNTTQALRSLNATTLYKVNALTVAMAPYSTFEYGPTVDGYFVPALPGQLFLNNHYHKDIAVFSGHNAMEGLTFVDPFVQNMTGLVSFVQQAFPGISNSSLTYLFQTLYPTPSNATTYSSTTGRLAAIVADLAIYCNTRYVSKSASPSANYKYYFDLVPGLHGQDGAYTYYSGDNTTLDIIAPVNVTLALAMQDYFTSFVQTGNPNRAGSGLPVFPAYGEQGNVFTYGNTALGTVFNDTDANSRCDWWQKAVFY